MITILKLKERIEYTPEELNINGYIWNNDKKYEPHLWNVDQLYIDPFDKLNLLYISGVERKQIVQIFNKRYPDYQFEETTKEHSYIAMEFYDFFEKHPDVSLEDLIFSKQYWVASNSKYYEMLKDDDLIDGSKIEYEFKKID